MRNIEVRKILEMKKANYKVIVRNETIQEEE